MRNMTPRRFIAASFVSLLALVAVSAYFLGRAHAAGAPTVQPLTYSGILTDTAGMPLTGMKNVQVTFWDMATDGSQACSAGPIGVTLATGGFRIALPPQCTTAIHTASELWVEVFVDGTSLGRTKLGAVPYALESQRASEANGALATQLSGLASRLDALEPRVLAVENKAVLTKIDILTSVASDAFHAACASSLNAQNCGVMAYRRCLALGYPSGWFVGESPDGNATLYIACVK